MAFTVRIFGYKGVNQIHQGFVRQYNSDSIFVMDEPCEWSQSLTTNGTTPVTSTSQNPDAAHIVWVEVPDGQTIRYEIQPHGPTGTGARIAGVGSRKMSGENAVFWYGPGTTISVIDAAGT